MFNLHNQLRRWVITVLPSWMRKVMLNKLMHQGFPVVTPK